MRPLPALLWLPIVLLGAQSQTAERGFEYFYNLEYDRAIAEFEKAIAEDPRNPLAYNFVAQGLLFREMFRNGALESELVTGNNSFLRRPKMNPPPQVEIRFHGVIQDAMSLAQTQLARDPKDTRALYALGVAYGLRANYRFLARKVWRDSLSDATAARKLHNRVTELDPSNYDARLVQALYDYLLGSLPPVYRMMGFLSGFHGDKQRGINTLQEVARKGAGNLVDAEIFLCALYRREGRPSLALPLLKDLLRRYPRNFLLRLEQAQMYSTIGDQNAALSCLQKVADLKKNGAAGYEKLPWEKIFFHMGNIQFWYNDLEHSLENMQKVTAAANELDLNTGVLAWMRLGQIYDLTHRRQLAVEAYHHAIAYAPQADAAKESRRYLASPYRRDQT